ncbi:MAG: TetR/AcrR family transcriptional regulator [Rhodoferax sp.]
MHLTERPTKQRTEVRQAGLVEAALQLAAQRSPSDISTGDLARAVGITQGAVFKHFASKEAIWLAVLDWATDTLMTRLQAAAQEAQQAPSPPSQQATSGPALAALRAVFLAHVGFAVEQPGVPRVVFQELQSPGNTAPKMRVRALLQRYRQLLMLLLQQAEQEQGLAPGTNLQAAAVLFIGSVQGLVMQALISGDVPAMALQAPGVFALYQRALQSHPQDSQGNP